jgi:hypothetical protein
MNVCSNCFNDIELKKFIESDSSLKGGCDFCDNDVESEIIKLEELLDFFVDLLDVFQQNEEGKPLIELINDDWNLFSNNDVGSKMLAVLFPLLKSQFSNPNQKVTYTDEIIDCTTFWETLKNNLKWERRFLTNARIFVELGWDGFFDRNNSLPEGKVLYRARVHKNDGQAAFATTEMGSPNKEKAFAGRANPHGIPYLYLSTSSDTTFYETRATYLDEISIGKFRAKKDEVINLVDFTAEISLFLNIENINGYVKSVILKKYISVDLSKPLRRYDSELEYIPTQFICEFIRNISDADGIMFNSSLHVGGKNIVLFKENKMECIEVLTYRVTDVNIQYEQIS